MGVRVLNLGTNAHLIAQLVRLSSPHVILPPDVAQLWVDQHLKLHSYTDVAKLFKECSDDKGLAKFMVLVNQGGYSDLGELPLSST
jgi:hypothetical protein